MNIDNDGMDISVALFKAHCLDLIRSVEKGGEAVVIKRRGKVVTRLTPPQLFEKQAESLGVVAGVWCVFGEAW
jgi:antitoxin (DNA-binding transcriptional repressor) of toxin-antitoxin stability system